MPTTAANGSSQKDDTLEATSDALTEALGKLSLSANFGLIFSGSRHNLQTVLGKARELCPGTVFAACHTAGEYTEKGLSHGGLVVLLVHSPDMLCSSSFSGDISEDVDKSAQELAGDYNMMLSQARAQGLGLSSTLLLLDGLIGTGDRLVRAVQKKTRMFQNIVGGAAGDDGAFHKPWVGTEKDCGPCGAAAINVFHRQPWAVGVGHGLTAQTGTMRVTRASGNVVHEIDGKPAFDTYREYARQKGIELNPEDVNFLIGNELGVFLLNKLHHARAPVRVGAEGELHLVAEISSGAQVCILDGKADSMVEACRQAAFEALEGLKGGRAAAVVVFDCVCRGMILGDGFHKEIEALASVFPDTPIIGFLTYGEIARTGGRLDGWHNTTSVVLALPQ